MNTFIQLYLSFFQIGLFSVGGGYAAMPLIQEQVVTIHNWLNMTQFGDIVAIAEMTPGPIAINAATFVGTQVAGLPGAIVATLGCVTPSCFIVLTLAWVYYRFRGLDTVKGILAGLRPAVVAMIGSAGLSLVLQSLWGGAAIGIKTLDLVALLIFLSAFLVLRRWKPSPIAVMAASGLAGLVLYSIF